MINNRTFQDELVLMRQTAIFLSLLFSTLSFSKTTSISSNQWQTVLGVGAGITNTINLGQSIFFPIQNPAIDEYYRYTPQNQTQTTGLIELFSGVEKPFQQFSRDWIIQMGLAYSQSGSFKEQGTLEQGADPQSANQYAYKYSTTLRQLMFETKIMAVYAKWRPFLLLGLGGAINTAYDYKTTVPVFETFTRQYNDSTKGSIAYRIGVGVEWWFTDQLRAGLGYRFADLGKISLSTPTINQTIVNGNLSQAATFANEVLFQLSYRL